MSDSDGRSWWNTLPGILTALGTFFAAIGTVISALVGAGVLNKEESPRAVSGLPNATSHETPRYRQYPEKHINTRTAGGRGAVYNGCDGDKTVEVYVCVGPDGTGGGVKFVIPPGKTMYFDAEKGSTYRYNCDGPVSTTCPSPGAWVPLIEE